MLANIMVILIILCILFIAVRHIYKAKKAGVHCIGCPHGGSCSRKSCNSCNSQNVDGTLKN